MAANAQQQLSKAEADQAALEAMSDDQLKDTLKKLREEAAQLVEERNFFSVERDHIVTFASVLDEELAEAHAALLNKERDLEDGEEKHQLEIKVYKQKVKHMLFEFSHAVDHHRRTHESHLSDLATSTATEQTHLAASKRALHRQTLDLQQAHEDEIRTVKRENAREVEKVTEELRVKEEKLARMWEDRVKELRSDLEIRAKTEVHEIEERKNLQLSVLTKQHDKAFAEMKTYYNDITLNNLALINSLKEQSATMTARAATHTSQTALLLSQNKTLSQPLSQARAACDSLRRDLANHDKLKSSLRMVTERCREMQRKADDARLECEKLKARMEQAGSDTREWVGGWADGVKGVVESGGEEGKRKALEAAIRHGSEELQKKDSQLTSLLASLPTPLRTSSPTAPASRRTSRRLTARAAETTEDAGGKPGLTIDRAKKIMSTVERLVDEKNGKVRELREELERAAKAQSALKNTVEAKLTEVGLQLSEV